MSNKKDEIKCPTCGGTGRQDDGNAGYQGPCRQCGGAGWIYASDSPDDATDDTTDKSDE